MSSQARNSYSADIAGTKRRAPSPGAWPRKRSYSLPYGGSSHISGAPPQNGSHGPHSNARPARGGDDQWSARWLVESVHCARILGNSGNRLRSMKESCREPGVAARISTKQADTEFRIFSCSASPLSIAKIAGLVVRAIYNESEVARSSEASKLYDLKLLVPERHVARLVGPQLENLVDIEGRSNARLVAEPRAVADSDEVCLHVFGVADAVQIALYFVLETLRKIAQSEDDGERSANPFQPAPGLRLRFEAGFRSDVAVNDRSDRDRDRDRERNDRNDRHDRNDRNDKNDRSERSSRPAKLTLPPLEEEPELPPSIFTAYDIARDSQRPHLRQIVQLDALHKGSEADRKQLLENIGRVTACRAEVGIAEHDHFAQYLEDDESESNVSIVVEGAPEENLLALFLIYRFVRSEAASQSAAKR